MKYCDVCHSTYPADFTTCPRDQAQLRSTTELMTGMVIRGKYEIQGKIGSGGMATVYRARHLVFNEQRAIKVVGSRMMEDENFLKRFRNEAVVTRKLQHPNAVRVDDIDTMEDGRPFIVMELVEGPNLRSVIEKEGALEPARALEITRQVASALAAAHSLGIVHRDIKPDNIVLVTRDGSDLVKVLDFGIAKLREGVGEKGEKGSAYTTTQTGMLIGTPQYVSPEQASGKPGEEIDGRSDIYSLGIVLFQMLTGKLPFNSDTPMGLLLQHMQTPAPAPQAIRPELQLDSSTTQLVLKCLEKDPAKRFQVAQELIASIRPGKSDLTPETRQMFSYDFQPTGVVPTVAPAHTVAATVATAAATAVAAAPAKSTPSHAGRWIAIVVVVAAIATGAYFYLGRQAKPDTPPATVSQPAAEKPASPAPAAEKQTTPAAPAATTNPADAERERRVKELVSSGRRHVDNGEYAQAIRDLKQALAIAPDNPAARAELRRAELAQKTEEKVLGKH